MKRFLFSVVVLAAVIGCKKTEVSSEGEYGFISLNLSSDAEMTVVTKAELTEAELAGYNVTLKDMATNEVVTKEYAEISKDGWKVAPGTYSVFVENLTDAEAAPAGDKGTIRLAGLGEDVLVAAGVPTPVDINCTPANSRVTVAYDEAFEQVFANAKVNIGTVDRNFDMVWGHEAANGVYYPGETPLSWTISADLSGNSAMSKSFSSEEPVTTVAGKWTQITFTTSTTDGSIKVNITVESEFSETDDVIVPIDPFEDND